MQRDLLKNFLNSADKLASSALLDLMQQCGIEDSAEKGSAAALNALCYELVYGTIIKKLSKEDFIRLSYYFSHPLVTDILDVKMIFGLLPNKKYRDHQDHYSLLIRDIATTYSKTFESGEYIHGNDQIIILIVNKIKSVFSEYDYSISECATQFISKADVFHGNGLINARLNNEQVHD